MARLIAKKPHQVSNNTAVLATPPDLQPSPYLATVHTQLARYQRARGFRQRQTFVSLIHTFMQGLCGYPPATYIVTTAAYGDPQVGGYPHAMPAAYTANPTLFYFTPSEELDAMHDLWVKHAQVYLLDPYQDDVIATCATQVIFSNFIVIDGAQKDPLTGAWRLWSVADPSGAMHTRLDLRHMEVGTAPDATDSGIVHESLQTLQYRSPSGAGQPDTLGRMARGE